MTEKELCQRYYEILIGGYQENDLSYETREFYRGTAAAMVRLSKDTFYKKALHEINAASLPGDCINAVRLVLKRDLNKTRLLKAKDKN